MRKALSAVAVFCLLGACVSCSNSAERDTSRKAVLDYSKNYVHLPLDEYAFDELTLRTVSTAWHTLMSECYAHHGQSYAVPSVDTPQPGGLYGSWNVEYAKKYGYSQKESRGPEDSASDDINTRCQEEVKAAFSDVELDEKEYRFVGELNSQAYTYASQTDEWKNIRSEWWTCLRERGLTPREGESDWISEESAHLMTSSPGNEEAKPEEIRLATIEAQCSEKVRLAQRLGDLEASYQGPLIEKNQALLNELKAERDAKIAKAREIIATHQ